jgi:hypothetical protein
MATAMRAPCGQANPGGVLLAVVTVFPRVGRQREDEFPTLRNFELSREWRRRDDKPPISGRLAEIVKQNPASYEVTAEPDPASIVVAHTKNLPGGKHRESP